MMERRLGDSDAEDSSNDNGERDDRVILYPAGGRFNRLRRKQHFLNTLLTDSFEGWENAQNKKDYVVQNILSKIPGGIWVFDRVREVPVRTNAKDVENRILQKMRDMKKSLRGGRTATTKGTTTTTTAVPSDDSAASSTRRGPAKSSTTGSSTPPPRKRPRRRVVRNDDDADEEEDDDENENVDLSVDETEEYSGTMSKTRKRKRLSRRQKNMIQKRGGMMEPSDDESDIEAEDEEEEVFYTDQRNRHNNHHQQRYGQQHDVEHANNVHLEAAEIVERALQPGGIDSGSDNDSDSDHLPTPIFIDHLSYHNETTTASLMMTQQQHEHHQLLHHHQQQQPHYNHQFHQHHPHHAAVSSSTVLLTQDSTFCSID